MTYIHIEFQSVPMRMASHGYEYGDSDLAVSEISFTAVIEAESRENWRVAGILVWLRGSVPSRINYDSPDRSSDPYRDIKGWLESDEKARDKINDYVALEILPSGRLVAPEAGRAGEAVL